MHSSRAIITPFEVRKYSPAGPHYPLDNIRLMLDVIEFDFFRLCLGVDLYDAMRKDARRWDAATLWNPSSTYNTGDLVVYDGAVLESTKASNTSEPSGLNDSWKEAAKFTKKTYNTMWEAHLRRLLAFDAYRQTLTYDTIKSGAKGLSITTQDQSGAMTAPVKEIEYTKTTIQRHIDVMVESMKKWIIDQHQMWKDDNTKGIDFSAVSFIADDCEECNVPGKINRRIGFLN